MLPIAIFENDKSFAQWLEAEIRQHTHYPTVMNTASFDQMKTFIKENKESTLYFLDIVDETRENEPVGLDLAREIFQSNESSLVVFVSSYLEHIWYHSEFKTRSFSFIEKNPAHLQREIVETINLAQRHFDQNALHISGRAEDIHIPFKEICLIESVPHVQNKIRIKGLYGSYILTKTIREVEPLLDGRFLKVHQSYLINQDNIRSIDKRTRQIFFVDGSQCFYARRNTSTINNLSIR